MKNPMTLLALVLGLAACGGPERAVAPAAATPAGPERCLLLTSNDSEANFDGAKQGPGFQGRIARIAAEKQRLLALRPGAVLLVEGGDMLQGRYMERQDGNRPLAMQNAWQVYQAAGYDYAAIGNHEFDAGPKALRVAMQGLDHMRLLSANLDAKGTSLDPSDPQHPQGLFGSSALVRCGGLQLGLIGLTTPTTRTISQLGDVRFAKATTAQVTQIEAQKLRAQGAQVVVVLSHLGLENDVELAGDVTGLDAIVGGHSHSETPQVQQRGQTWITQSGSRFSHLGALELAVDASGRFDPAHSAWKLQPIEQLTARDPQVAAQVDALRQTLVQEVVIGQRKLAWDLRDARGDYSRRATRALGQWAKSKVPSVVGALLNVGGFRSDTLYPPGPVTNLEVKAIHPFDNRLVLVTLTGQQLLDTLEHSCIPGSEGHGQGLVLWGVTGTCNFKAATPQYRVVDGRPVEILKRGERLQGASVNGAPVDLGARYTVATIDYLARGGSGFLPLTQGERKCVDGSAYVPPTPCRDGLMADVMIQAVQTGMLDAD
ncbi:MAG: bifunctional metallophosphatase/5'-nucleotidase [Deltaproteobacteria bacterium]|nr:bifunctional metallophosphatase/5'-nucleotidase [Deltaproteobacteria bacterium]